MNIYPKLEYMHKLCVFTNLENQQIINKNINIIINKIKN